MEAVRLLCHHGADVRALVRTWSEGAMCPLEAAMLASEAASLPLVDILLEVRVGVCGGGDDCAAPPPPWIG